ncbi:MAG: hypothetical protein QOE61_268 [Micromonosporaceae bacterium]|jgi:hypothetical protein|nr:hypothetical protein [Micromonosporaceae bacterium]
MNLPAAKDEVQAREHNRQVWATVIVKLIDGI